MSRQKGLALVIVLWVLSLMTIMAASFVLTMRRETTVISAVKDQAELLSAAETGLAIAQQKLSVSDLSKRWHADGSIYQVTYRNVEIRLRLLSEQGKIDINKADESQLRTLFQATSLDLDTQQALTSAIIDWRDQDDLVYINGAEKKEYEQAGMSYGPANKNFQFLEELQLVLGMTSEIFRQLQPLITVYSGQQQVDVQLASAEVLRTIPDLDPAVIDEYLQQRAESARLQLPIPEFPQISSDKYQQGGNEVYTVVAQARSEGVGDAGIKVVMRRASSGGLTTPFQVLDWQQTYQTASLFSSEMEPFLVTIQNESGQ